MILVNQKQQKVKITVDFNSKVSYNAVVVCS
jgi:hypothetical protein